MGIATHTGIVLRPRYTTQINSKHGGTKNEKASCDPDSYTANYCYRLIIAEKIIKIGPLVIKRI